jgi:hypothetical protein
MSKEIKHNNFEALMPLIAKYVQEHPDEYKKYLEEKEQKKNKSLDKAKATKK